MMFHYRFTLWMGSAVIKKDNQALQHFYSGLIIIHRIGHCWHPPGWDPPHSYTALREQREEKENKQRGIASEKSQIKSRYRQKTKSPHNYSNPFLCYVKIKK